ncbi:MAG TPA: hypothetical protein VFP65_03505 [Anaeromyxobacteraceae bacterium]|nr:hypothetical protein [Anaeromyxobacteraceae bacterium]
MMKLAAAIALAFSVQAARAEPYRALPRLAPATVKQRMRTTAAQVRVAQRSVEPVVLAADEEGPVNVIAIGMPAERAIEQVTAPVEMVVESAAPAPVAVPAVPAVPAVAPVPAIPAAPVLAQVAPSPRPSPAGAGEGDEPPTSEIRVVNPTSSSSQTSSPSPSSSQTPAPALAVAPPAPTPPAPAAQPRPAAGPAPDLLVVRLPPLEPSTSLANISLGELRTVVDVQTPSGDRVEVLSDGAGALLEIVRDRAGNIVAARNRVIPARM